MEFDDIRGVLETHRNRTGIVLNKLASYIIDANNIFIQAHHAMRDMGNDAAADFYQKLYTKGIESAEDISEVIQNYTDDLNTLTDLYIKDLNKFSEEISNLIRSQEK